MTRDEQKAGGSPAITEVTTAVGWNQHPIMLISNQAEA